MSITQKTNKETYIFLPNQLTNFRQTGTDSLTDVDGKTKKYFLDGIIASNEHSNTCPHCQHKANINCYTIVSLTHVSLGGIPVVLRLTRKQYICPYCHYSFQDEIAFKADKHFITKQLQQYIESLLATHAFTITAIHRLTSVHPATIKDIDKRRLKQKYTSVHNPDGNLRYCYKIPKAPVKFLGIDEFSLHRHHQYATVIMNLETSEVLFVAYGHKKQVVYDFIDIAQQAYSMELGENFMNKVKAVASDMNSDYEEAFLEKCPHLKIVYDHFHIVKNFNEGVINKVKKDEYARLWKEGKWQEANLLKKSKYLLIANYDKLSSKGQGRVDQILSQNKLLLLADIVKEQLKCAYESSTVLGMLENIYGIIELCRENQNEHFLWFAKLLEDHLEGIITHGLYKISTGKVEGTNNKIKTTRRQAYGFRDDEYFFLKILDMTIEK